MRAIVSLSLSLLADALALTWAVKMMRVPARRNRPLVAIAAVSFRRTIHIVLASRLPRAAGFLTTLAFGVLLQRVYRLGAARALALAVVFAAARPRGPR